MTLVVVCEILIRSTNVEYDLRQVHRLDVIGNDDDHHHHSHSNDTRTPSTNDTLISMLASTIDHHLNSSAIILFIIKRILSYV